MANLCIIPARGGSKRIPRKNIKDFLGKPIIAYAIENAIKSNLFDEVMVSTDDDEIANVAKKCGANVPFMRSKEKANDYATLADVVDEVINSYERKFEYVCCLLPTAVLCSSLHLIKGYELLKKSNFDSIRPIVKFSYPIQRAFRLNEDGSVQWFQPDEANSRTQDLMPAYHDSGQFYWFKALSGLRSSRRGAFEMDELSVQDIDNEADWKLAELKFQLIHLS